MGTAHAKIGTSPLVGIDHFETAKVGVTLAYYRDMSAYRYGNGVPNAVNIGWLGWRNPFFRRGQMPEELVEKLKRLALNPEWKTRGYHRCPFCPPGKRATIRVGAKVLILGSAEIVVESDLGKVYDSPDLIVHYVEKHSYLPPPPFLRHWVL
ncbi:DUF7919 family protein [Streptomyces rectiviolaceus]